MTLYVVEILIIISISNAKYLPHLQQQVKFPQLLSFAYTEVVPLTTAPDLDTDNGELFLRRQLLK